MTEQDLLDGLRDTHAHTRPLHWTKYAVAGVGGIFSPLLCSSPVFVSPTDHHSPLFIIISSHPSSFILLFSSSSHLHPLICIYITPHTPPLLNSKHPLSPMPMSQSTRSDQSQGQPQGMATEMMMSDAALQQVTSERNSLRSQNDQLWKIIEKQRVIIQNLQKDVAKVSAERDLLRASVPPLTSGSPDASAALPVSEGGTPSLEQDQSHMPHQYQSQPNGHHLPQQGYQSSKRSMDRKPQDADSATPELNGYSGGERESELASGFNPNSSFSSTTSSTTDHRHIQQQPRQHPQDRHSPRQHRAQGQPVTLPLTPSSTHAYDLNGGKAELDEEEPIYDNNNSHRHEDIVQPSPTISLQQHQSPVAHLEREVRTGRTEAGNAMNGVNGRESTYYSRMALESGVAIDTFLLTELGMILITHHRQPCP